MPSETVKIDVAPAAGVHHNFPHLTTEELAARWRCNRFTISHRYQRLGLRPMRIGKRLLFPIDQIEEAEHRAMGRPR